MSDNDNTYDYPFYRLKFLVEKLEHFGTQYSISTQTVWAIE